MFQRSIRKWEQNKAAFYYYKARQVLLSLAGTIFQGRSDFMESDKGWKWGKNTTNMPY